MNISLVVIGGGATGTGIARAAAEAGYSVTLIEQGGMASGTTGHFHGMLHSGARYAVNDPAVAAACYGENQRLRQLVPSVIRDTGGLFVAMNDDEAKHAEILQKACLAAGIPMTEISPEQARRQEPHLAESIQRAFIVPDGTIDGGALVPLNRTAAEQATVPARFITNTQVTGFSFREDAISAVHVKHVSSGKTEQIACDFVINATGVWAGRITALANITLDMVFDKGTMIVLKEQLSSAVLNRCRPEGDGDLLVPFKGQSIIGTTARTITDLNNTAPTQEEADVLIREGSGMVPELATAEAVRVYAGVRPLIRPRDAQLHSSRSISRGFQVLDHAGDGVANFVSITGGKVTLYQLMTDTVMQVVNQRYL